MCNNYQLTYGQYEILQQLAEPGITQHEIDVGWLELPPWRKFDPDVDRGKPRNKAKTLFGAEPMKAKKKKEPKDPWLPKPGHNRWLIRRSMYAPIVLDNAGDPKPLLARWGFDRRTAPRIKQPIINNTRSDAITGGKSIWDESWNMRRCLVPVSCIFEWRQEWGKDPNRPEKTYPFAIVPIEPVMIAGVWEPDDHHGRAFSMLTTDAPESTKHVHDRLPLFLPQPVWDEYLYSSEAPGHLLSPYEGELEVFACENVLLKKWKPGPPQRT